MSALDDVNMGAPRQRGRKVEAVALSVAPGNFSSMENTPLNCSPALPRLVLMSYCEEILRTWMDSIGSISKVLDCKSP